jgi:hypothetical protein
MRRPDARQGAPIMTKSSPTKPLYAVAVQVPEPPRAVFFVTQTDRTPGGSPVADVTRRVKRLTIEAVSGDANGDHFLRRLDYAGNLVWRTRHPSLQETFWQAEWEYGVPETAWVKRLE